jgi:hypothetical protein
MEYTTPEIEVVGTGSDLIQAFFGPYTDGGLHSLSLGAVSPQLDEE